MDRAKQYNYVRKFSVDISALQAQLQNPKIFRDAPYQSDIDLSRKPSSDVSKSPVSKPLLPLNSLTGKFDEKDEKRVDKEKRGDEFVRTCTNNQPPPVITVSNDDAPSSSDEEEEDVLNEIRGSQERFHEDNKHNDKARNTPTQKPTMLNFNEATQDHNSAPTLESAASGPSDTGSEGLKMARLTMMMSLAFVINMLPVVVTEILESRLSRHAFINIFTCTVAVSTLQTMVYPRMLVTCDDVVRRAIRKLKIRVENVFICRSKRNVHNQGEDSSSSTDQL
uniref:Uncharacterized protein n=1 Tax=Arion vulgaris TaxID=1028688 RepID=A0A0B6YTZ7_9EUPU